MGILPLRLPAGTTPQSLALTVADRVGITLDPSRLEPRGPVRVAIHRVSGRVEAFEASLEVETLAKGGLMPLILDRATRAEAANLTAE
ncbi:hypothetical protein [Paracoccus sp. pheM1]|uniref:hypothetical protein n=1 Tax=Paracoccus sp. pheM1 TaxID=2831675 RepID=UPI0023E770DA|nr:hypothetical protein [Paracoccus sp. pheM1]